MPVYIAPYDYSYSVLPEELNKEYSFCAIFYQMGNTRLGFSIDDRSAKILYSVVREMAWYNISNDVVEKIRNESFINKHFVPKGLLACSNDLVDNELKKAKEYSLAVKKNRVLKRNNRPILTEEPSIFNYIYSSVDKKYSSEGIKELMLKEIDFLIVTYADVGHFFITQPNSKTIERLKEICLDIDEPIFWLDDMNKLPCW